MVSRHQPFISPMMGLVSNHCDTLSSPSYVNFSISIFILLGILISYLPQHHRIITRRTSEGISPWFVLLGTTSGTCAFANILVLPASRADVACCKEISGFACFAGLLGIAQIGVQWMCFTMILLLFLLFFPRATTTLTPSAPKNGKPSFRTALSVLFLCAIHFLLTIFLTLLFYSRFPSHLQSWANGLGVLGTVLASIQYIPQLYTTWASKHVGSLSIPMMCIQTPGSFVWVGSLYARLGWEGWSTWGIYAVTGILQGGLLCMAICFEVKDRRKRKDGLDMLSEGRNGHAIDEASEAVHNPDEQTPLLRDET